MPATFDNIAAAAAWYDAWLGQAALPLWSSTGVDLAHGLFHEALSVEGVPVEGPRRARAQARQVFVFASAATAGYGAQWLPAAQAGYARFLEVYRRSDGLFLRRAAGDGTPLEDEADVYDQAFALLAMAALQVADPSAGDFAGDAARTLAGLQARRALAGGFQETGRASLPGQLPHAPLRERAGVGGRGVGGGRRTAVDGAQRRDRGAGDEPVHRC